MKLLFGAADRFVVVYSSDAEVDAPQKAHVRHRRFSDWVEEHAPSWEPLRRIPNPHDTSETAADFHIFRRSSDA
jgi:hypothetical protein